jgi:hypothetical protein
VIDQFFMQLLQNESLPKSVAAESYQLLVGIINQVFEGISEHNENLPNKGMTTPGSNKQIPLQGATSTPSVTAPESGKINDSPEHESVESRPASESEVTDPEEHTKPGVNNDEQPINTEETQVPLQGWLWLATTVATGVVVVWEFARRRAKSLAKK